MIYVAAFVGNRKSTLENVLQIIVHNNWGKEYELNLVILCALWSCSFLHLQFCVNKHMSTMCYNNMRQHHTLYIRKIWRSSFSTAKFVPHTQRVLYVWQSCNKPSNLNPLICLHCWFFDSCILGIGVRTSSTLKFCSAQLDQRQCEYTGTSSGSPGAAVSIHAVLVVQFNTLWIMKHWQLCIHEFGVQTHW